MIDVSITATLDTSKAEAIISAMLKEAETAIQVGWFNTKEHPDKLKRNQDPSTVAGVAYRNEFGVPPNQLNGEFGVPARPFIRRVFQVSSVDMQARYIRNIMRAAIMGKATANSNRNRLGRALKKELQSAIDNGTHGGPSSNSDYIATRKGFDHPLKGRTGILRNSIQYKKVSV